MSHPEIVTNGNLLIDEQRIESVRHTLVAIILALTPLTVGSVELYVGGATISVPTPAGLAHLTPHIQPLYDVSTDMTAQQNERLVSFVDEAIIPEALMGKMPIFERFINVEIMRSLKASTVTAADFNQLKKMTRANIEKTIAAMEKKMPGRMEDMSDRVGETLDLDIAFSVSNVVPMPVHHETDRVISNSMVVKYGMATPGSTSDHIVTVTTSFVFLKGKLIYVYVYGGPEDLAWTRDQAARWIDEVIALNANSADARN